MRYTTLGATDLRVSRLCLGTVFRQAADDGVYLATIEAALERGCTFFDTSNIYQGGRSEEILGRAMRGRRERFVVTTKVGRPEADDANARGLGRANILRCCERSLRRLATDYIDLYLCHFPDPSMPIEETVSAMAELVRQGKVRHVGCSNFESWRLCEALHVAGQRSQASFACNQVAYSLLDRRVEDEVLPYCALRGVGVTAYATTAIGLLSGRFRRGEPPPEGTSWHRGPYNFRAAMTPHVGGVIDTVVQVAGRLGRTPTQVAMAWCLSRPAVTSVIVGCDTPERVHENLAAADWELPEEEMRRLDEVSDGQRLTVRQDCPEGWRR